MIERGIMEALHSAKPGSSQELHGEALKAMLEAAKASGFRDPVLPTIPVTSETPHVESLSGEALQAELEAQAKRYIEFGFAKKLGMTQYRFKDRVMGLAAPQPESYKGRFDIPVVVIGAQVPAVEQYRMIGFDYYLSDLGIQDRDVKGYQTPNVPHLVWMQDGKVNLGKSVDKVRASFSRDERGANLYDGVGLVVARPDILKDHFIDLPGTQVGSGSAPFLNLWHDLPEVRCSFIDDTHSRFGSASGGR